MGRHNQSVTQRKKPKHAKKTLWRICGYLPKYWHMILISVFCTAFMTFGTIYATRLIGVAIDDYIITLDFRGLAKVCIVLLVVYISSSVFTWLQSYLMLWMGQDITANIRKELFRKFQVLPLSYYTHTTNGELMSRVTNDVDNISTMLNSAVSQVLQSILTVIGTLAVMLYLSVPMTIAVVAVIPIMLVLVGMITKRSRIYFREKQKTLGDLNGYIEEVISGQKVVKVFCREEAETEAFSKWNDALRRVGVRSEVFAGIIGPLMTMLNNITYGIVVIVGGMMMVLGIGQISLGIISNFIIYSKQFIRPFNELANQMNAILSAVAGAERVFEILDAEEEPRDDTDAMELSAMKGDVTLSDVSFSYDEGDTTLHHINLSVKAGQTVALVGPTGAGKTTIINLLSRFYDIDSGKITIDGMDIQKIKRSSIRSALGIVLQDTYLFTDTIRENIRYGRLDATDEEIEEAAKLSNAHEFIKHLPEGYDTVLSDGGGNLSQGQRQMLSIARAILANPSVLVLDEATSSVDTRTELHIQEGMENLMQGRTNFVIAHRLSTIRNADLIAVIDHGEIVERGSHDELMAQKGFYYNLYTNQIGNQSID